MKHKNSDKEEQKNSFKVELKMSLILLSAMLLFYLSQVQKDDFQNALLLEHSLQCCLQSIC